ncbi:sigma-70 family RNA polymerase sigma factor [Streptomyces sp. CAU 1734]|uniref:RNA polymerase sigma factor n=1 Tax=Streptomyces sp. CAU 1734 TaxID=3140360 RepID=UPI003261CE61
MADEADRFTTMYDACRGRVWAYVVSRAGRQVADEVVSETFTIAWRRRAEMPRAELPWLLGVARNVLRETVRAEVRRASFAAELREWTERSDRGSAEDIADDVADRSALLTALASLPEDDREVLILAAWQGFSPAEAAQVVGCTSAAMRVRLHRARKRLTRAVEATAGPSAAAVRRRVQLVREEV